MAKGGLIRLAMARESRLEDLLALMSPNRHPVLGPPSGHSQRKGRGPREMQGGRPTVRAHRRQDNGKREAARLRRGVGGDVLEQEGGHRLVIV